MRAVLLPNGNLLIPLPPADLEEPQGPALQEIGPEHPDDAEGDLQPWEQPGAFRRNCAPHRGRWP